MADGRSSGVAEVVIRSVVDVTELRGAFATVAPLFAARVDAKDDFRLQGLLDHFPHDQDLMLVAVDDTAQVRGAAFAYREGRDGVKVQLLAVDPAVRRRGVATRLLCQVEAAAVRTGRATIYLGAETGARAFYLSAGYSGRGDVLRKSLSGRALAEPAAARQQRLASLRSAREGRRST